MRIPIATVFSVLTLCHVAHAGLVININAGSTLQANSAALAAFNRAADQWEAIFTDDIEVNIDADLASLGGSILGQASSVTLPLAYSTIRNQMIVDADADDGILNALPTAAQFSAIVPTGFGLSGNLYGHKANLKALGFTSLDSLYGSNDATITFSSDFNFDFDNSDGVTGGSFDFESVAAHEIGHALGFSSIVDLVDFRLANGQVDSLTPSTLDLFRFDASNIPTTESEFTNFARDLRTGGTKFFSDLDNQWQFATGVETGDGLQASHWKDGLGIGLLDPTLAPGEISPITFADIRALDLMGYDFTAVPEPSSLSLVALAAWGLTVRRRRT